MKVKSNFSSEYFAGSIAGGNERLNNRLMEQNPSVKKTVLTITLFGIFLLCICSCANKIDSTEMLMKEIASRYNGKWFTHITFSQSADSYENDSLVKSEIWDEEYIFPSNLKIYQTPGDTSNRAIFRNDSAFYYENNELTEPPKKVTHDAIVLSMDIYNMSFPNIMKRWAELTPISYDISKFHETIYNGRKIYIVGADKGDTLSNQVWFDAEHLYFIKQIKKTEKGSVEVNFLDYIQLEGDKGWIEQGVEFKRNGKVYMQEKYFDIQVIK